MKDKIILASASPRRAKLLTERGIPYDVIPSSVNEESDPDLSPEENARVIAIRKADAVAEKYPGRLTLAADTIVVLDDTVLGKPADAEDAKKMLRALSGREHTVMSGIALVCPRKGVRWSHVEKSGVRFHHVPGADIDDYVAGGEPLDKAGAYAIQGGAGKWIESYSGSLSNIIGLPMEPLLQALETLGYETPKDGSAICR